MDLHEFEWMCMDLHRIAQICVDVRGCVWICMDSSGIAWALRIEWFGKDLYKYMWIVFDVHGFDWMSGFSRVSLFVQIRMNYAWNCMHYALASSICVNFITKYLKT